MHTLPDEFLWFCTSPIPLPSASSSRSVYPYPGRGYTLVKIPDCGFGFWAIFMPQSSGSVNSVSLPYPTRHVLSLLQDFHTDTLEFCQFIILPIMHVPDSAQPRNDQLIRRVFSSIRYFLAWDTPTVVFCRVFSEVGDFKVRARDRAGVCTQHSGMVR